MLNNLCSKYYAFLRDTKITHSVTKMMRVWKERKVYSSSFIGKLLAVLEGRESERHVTPMKMRSLNVGEHGFKVSEFECIHLNYVDKYVIYKCVPT